MKKFLFALAGVAALAVASASAPASAMPMQSGLAGTMNSIDQVQWHHPHHRGWGHPNHRRWGHHHRCWNERVMRRDRWGRAYWTTRRVCR
ncbi:MAG: hypothetical protein M9932_03900 [Xanthobacteraceae bacterium]|nr:hypothetical protein [Xanthobacteraceae bacterium]